MNITIPRRQLETAPKVLACFRRLAKRHIDVREVCERCEFCA
jgi:hypothetical protein